ncbi:hypothetical protein Dimus_033833, partial [Dionaea muscipula]
FQQPIKRIKQQAHNSQEEPNSSTMSRQSAAATNDDRPAQHQFEVATGATMKPTYAIHEAQ